MILQLPKRHATTVGIASMGLATATPAIRGECVNSPVAQGIATIGGTALRASASVSMAGLGRIAMSELAPTIATAMAFACLISLASAIQAGRVTIVAKKHVRTIASNMVSAMVALATAIPATLAQLVKAGFAWLNVICMASVRTALASARRVGKAPTVIFLHA